MKGKIYIALLISCMTLMLAGCQTAQRAETDSVQESEITADGETENSKESDGDNQHAEEVLLSDKENNTAGDKELNDGDDSDGLDEEVILFRSYPGETDGLLSVAVSTEDNFYVDLSMYPELQELVRKDRKEYEQHLRELQSSGTEDISVNEYIKRADTYVYSVLCIGCTEDVTEYTGFNYHVESGRALSLEDVVKDKSVLIDALAEQLYGSSSSVNPKDLAAELCKADNHAWYIGYQGLTFYVDASLLGDSSTTQYMPVMILFAEYSSLFYEEYIQVPEKYAVAEDAFSTIMYDLNEDGMADEINILGEGSDGNLEQLTIQIGDLEKTIKTESELVEEGLMPKYLRCHILHLSDGKNLIYLHTRYALDDLYYGIILEMSDSEIKVLNTEAGLSIQGEPLIDPQYIICTASDRMLGSIWDFYVGGCWQIDKSGQLLRKEGTEYYLPGDFQIETTAELKADEIEQEDESVIASQILLPVGTILTPLRTDNENFVDFISESGKVYRVKFELQHDSDYGRVGMIDQTVASNFMKAI